VLVLSGCERVTVPADYDRSHQLAFEFPWSHGLAASLIGGLALFLPHSGPGRSSRVALAVVAPAVLLFTWLERTPRRPMQGSA